MKVLNFLLRIIHPTGWKYVIVTLAVSALAGLVSAKLFWIGFAFALCCGFFFRDPARVTPTRPGLLVSPADGTITFIARAEPPPELGLGSEPRYKISIFLSVFDVHINRIPVDCIVEKKIYRPGKHINACLDKASLDNEAMGMRLRLSNGQAVGVVQIAGLIARRIVSYVTEGQPVLAGERFGLIKFGSRVDVYLPEGVNPLVSIGQYMLGGETVLADLSASEEPRIGKIR